MGGMDEAAAAVAVVLAAIAVAIFCKVFVFVARLDRNRIIEYFSNRGGDVQSITWSPFGTGWYGTENERLYRVQYQDRDGALHETYCKTGLITGVYFTEDRTVGRSCIARQDNHSWAMGGYAELLTENRRLREELARLKRDNK